jgi:glutaredoxin 3
MYTTAICPYCVRAKYLLGNKGVSFEEIRIDTDSDHAIMREMVQRSQRSTVPQIFIDDYHVGGYDELAALEMAGRLNSLLGLPDKD